MGRTIVRMTTKISNIICFESNHLEIAINENKSNIGTNTVFFFIRKALKYLHRSHKCIFHVSFIIRFSK